MVSGRLSGDLFNCYKINVFFLFVDKNQSTGKSTSISCFPLVLDQQQGQHDQVQENDE